MKIEWLWVTLNFLSAELYEAYLSQAMVHLSPHQKSIIATAAPSCLMLINL
jgi:hypothetical protein